MSAGPGRSTWCARWPSPAVCRRDRRCARRRRCEAAAIARSWSPPGSPPHAGKRGPLDWAEAQGRRCRVGPSLRPLVRARRWSACRRYPNRRPSGSTASSNPSNSCGESSGCGACGRGARSHGLRTGGAWCSPIPPATERGLRRWGWGHGGATPPPAPASGVAPPFAPTCGARPIVRGRGLDELIVALGLVRRLHHPEPNWYYRAAGGTGASVAGLATLAAGSSPGRRCESSWATRRTRTRRRSRWTWSAPGLSRSAWPARSRGDARGGAGRQPRGRGGRRGRPGTSRPGAAARGRGARRATRAARAARRARRSRAGRGGRPLGGQAETRIVDALGPVLAP